MKKPEVVLEFQLQNLSGLVLLNKLPEDLFPDQDGERERNLERQREREREREREGEMPVQRDWPGG